MNIAEKMLYKICALIIIITLTISDFLFVGTSAISYAVDYMKTNNANVEFSAYFIDSNGEKTDKSEKEINTQDEYLYVDISVRNEGFFNGTITIDNSNFNLKSEILSEGVSKIEGNTVYLNQINAGSTVTIKLGIEPINNTNISIDMFDKISSVVLNGQYVYSKNVEKDKYIEIKGTTKVEMLWKSSQDVKAELEESIITNSIYEIDGVQKRVVQILVNSNITNNNYPVKNTQINISVPENVENVKVHSRSTKATNSSISFNESNYIYDSINKLVTIKVNNEDTNNINWNKNSQDVFVVTFIFDANENVINKEISANSIINTYDDKNLQANKNVHIEENIDGIVSYSIESTENNIYKGKLYSGEEREFTETSTIYIDLNNIVDSLSFDLNKSVYTTSSIEEEANIKFKQTKISKSEFLNLFGTDGFITISDENNILLANINKDSEVDENGYIVINTDAEKYKFNTSKPISIGALNIINNKVILNSSFSREKVNSLTGIKESISGSYNNDNNMISNNDIIELKNTSSKAKLNVSTNTLSTIEKNENVKITAVLLNNDESKDLYQDPSVKITLPSQVTNISNAKCKILYKNGLELSEAKVNNENGKNIIEVNLSGTQETYNTENLEGTTIIIYADMEVNKLAVSSDEEIVLNYTNGLATTFEDDGIVSSKVKILSTSGIITTNNITELKTETIGNEGTKNIILDINKEEKNATVNISIINNEESSLSNVTILGQFPTLTDLGINLTSEINTIDNATVYYTDNENATTDLTNAENKWSSAFNINTAKKYLIVIPNMENGEKVEANYTIKIPSNLKYNLSASEGFVVNYTNNLTSVVKEAQSTILNLTTGTGAELESNIKAYIAGNEIKDGTTVNSGEIIKYVVTVKNTGTEEAKNINLKTRIPENTTYVKYVKAIDNWAESDEALTGTMDYIEEIEIENREIVENIETIQIGEEKVFTYDVRIEDGAKNTTISTSATVDYLGNTNNENIDTKQSNVVSNKVNDAELAMNMIMVSRGEKTVEPKHNYSYFLNITNKSNSNISNTSVEIKSNSDFKLNLVLNNDDEVNFENNKFNIDLIKPGETKTFEINAEYNSTEGMTNIYAIANNLYYSNEVSDQIKETSISVSMKSENEGEVIKNGDMITYDITVTNDGTETIDYLEISQNLSTYLNVSEVTVNGKNTEFDIGINRNESADEQEENNEEEENEEEINENTIEESNSYNLGFEYSEELKAGESLKIKVKTLSDNETSHAKNIHLVSLAEVKARSLSVQSEEVNHILTSNLVSDEEDNVEKKENPEEDVDQEEPTEQEKENKEENDNNPSNSNKEDNDKQNENHSTTKENVISGTAWLDQNENGSRDANEQNLKEIKVKLLNLENNVLTETTTSENGFYSISNVKNGKYVVIFEYDTEKYVLTTYQAENVNESRNSDVENVTMNLNGESKKVASTDTLIINDNNLTNVDLGLIEAKVFDLSLTKTVSKVTATNSVGTSSNEYNDATIAKVEVKAKNLNNTLVAIEYKFKVTNNGEVAGYAKKIVDYKPSDLSFNSSLNPSWYQSGDYLYSTSLADTKIEAGETKELTLVLTKKMTESNTGLTNNTAEIAEDYNSYGIQDKDSTPGNKQLNEDDMGSSNVIISVSTGAAVSYVALTLSIIVLIGIGAYIIAKKVLRENIKF